MLSYSAFLWYAYYSVKKSAEDSVHFHKMLKVLFRTSFQRQKAVHLFSKINWQMYLNKGNLRLLWIFPLSYLIFASWDFLTSSLSAFQVNSAIIKELLYEIHMTQSLSVFSPQLLNETQEKWIRKWRLEGDASFSWSCYLFNKALTILKWMLTVNCYWGGDGQKET